MAKQIPGKYKKGVSYRRKCVKSQRLRRAREKRERDLIEKNISKCKKEKSDLKCGEGINVAGSSKPPKPTSNANFNKEQEAGRKTSASENVSSDLREVSKSKTARRLTLRSSNKSNICNQVNSEQVVDTEQQYKNHVISENKFPGGRFICDLKSVIRQAREIEAHSDECKFQGQLTYSTTITEGLVHTFNYSCSSPHCGATMKLVTDSDGKNLNRLAVLGAASTGSGFSQEERKFRAMNLKYINKHSEYNQSGVKFAHKDTMTEAVAADAETPALLQPKIELDFSIDET